MLVADSLEPADVRSLFVRKAAKRIRRSTSSPMPLTLHPGANSRISQALDAIIADLPPVTYKTDRR